ncbi:hypothetical protein DAPPUDRAFT_269379 [Daphnia pulex]|uniref:Uncharacterized protein n=1 Tax=Daphnia pulex TaxID=6669 RepID=E9HZ87_DAPPU|nr:hypothetical protein DAPPUDRAFT_269379 [Daphnia pulex]|eukprot:EFX62941.1 hypothetical protein DAPPUDRAFT_269379 [Daphnia pulex]
MYGPTQNTAQQTFDTTPIFPPLMVSTGVSQLANNAANWNHQPFPYETTTDVHQNQVLSPFRAQRFGPGPPELNNRQASQSSAVLEQVQQIRPVITPGLADQSNELSDGSKSVLTKLVKEVLKLQENIANVMTKMVVIEGKIELMARPIESEATAIDADFMTEPLKEIEDIKALEQTLLDNDKYYQLVTIIRNIEVDRLVAQLSAHEAVRNTGGRRAKDYELEKITKQMMKGMPEKYRNSLLKPAAEMEVDEEDGVEVMREQAVRENRPSLTSDKINIKVEIIEFVKSQLKLLPRASKNNSALSDIIKEPEYYPKAPEYFIKTYAAPSYYTDAPKYYSASSNKKVV